LAFESGWRHFGGHDIVLVAGSADRLACQQAASSPRVLCAREPHPRSVYAFGSNYTHRTCALEHFRAAVVEDSNRRRRQSPERADKSGVFERIFKLLASDHDNEYMMIDATIVRAHQHSAGARKKTGRKRSADRAVD
jgi:transposase